MATLLLVGGVLVRATASASRSDHRTTLSGGGDGLGDGVLAWLGERPNYLNQIEQASKRFFGHGEILPSVLQGSF
eukprot:scaffold752_cov322-Pavlova_lutheri.AAC.2